MTDPTAAKLTSNSRLKVPTGIIGKNLSDTSEAIDCFAGQYFSQDLQVYLINYVATIISAYPIYGG